MSSLGVAFVTGASQGIGRAIALRLARDGFDVAVNDIPRRRDKLESLCQEISAKGRKTSVQVGDASLNSEVESMIASVAENMGGLNVVSSAAFDFIILFFSDLKRQMVANAGICIAKPILESALIVFCFQNPNS